jgi:hypothetical protein
MAVSAFEYSKLREGNLRSTRHRSHQLHPLLRGIVSLSLGANTEKNGSLPRGHPS